MATILVVDDDPSVLEAISRVLKREGHTVLGAATGEAALAADADAIDVALLDMSLPDMTGMELLAALLSRNYALPCLFVTAFGSIPSAVAAMKAGAFDYITKPFDNDLLRLTVDRVLNIRSLKGRVDTLEKDLEGRSAFPEILGSSEAVAQLRSQLLRASRSDVAVILTGESGTGKGLAARAMHQHSSRSSGPFVPINCAAIPSSLAEAELFGVERGAYTDAREARAGVFERAHGGTLFLDEIGDMALDVQAKLLRVLEDHQVTRLGGQRSRAVNVRIVAATNKDIRKAELFRSDMLHRLNGFPIRVPTLRDRREDLPILIGHLLDRLNGELCTHVTSVSPQLLAWFNAHPFPGNIRELENLLRYGMLLCDDAVLDRRHYVDLDEGGGEADFETQDDHDSPAGPLTMMVARATAELERSAIMSALRQHRGNRSQAARALGIGRRTLFNKMQQYGLSGGKVRNDEEGEQCRDD